MSVLTVLVPLEGFVPPGVGSFDLPPLIPGVEWANKYLLQAVLSVFVIMGFCAAIGLDPVLQIFGPLGGLGIWALSVLWLLTTIAVIVFFKRRGGPTNIIVLAVAATLALIAAVVLIAVNLTLVVGGSTTLAIIFGVSPLVFLAIGAAVSGRAPDELSDPPTRT